MPIISTMLFLSMMVIGKDNSIIILYYVILLTETCQGGFIVAYAGPCIVLPAAGNIPIIGYVNVCPTASYNLQSCSVYLVHPPTQALDRFSTDFIDTLLIHETMHALAFLRSLFERYR